MTAGPTPEQVAALAAFVELGTQAAAAAKLGITERALKLRIRRLRQALDVETTEQAVYVCRSRMLVIVPKYE